MNESQKQLYSYLKDNGLTDLSADKFFSAYSDPSKSKEIHAYLKQNGLTDLDANAFHVAYFSPAKKKSTTGSQSVQPKKSTSSATMPSWMQSSLESSVKKEEKPKKPAGPQVVKSSELNKNVQAEKIASMAGGGTAGISGVGAINAKPKKEEAPDFDVYYGYPGQEKNKYRISNGRWERQYGDKWVEVTNQGSINSLTKFFGKENEIAKEEVFTGFPGKEENKYRVSELQNGQKVWEVQRVGQKDYTVISDQGSIDALNRQFDQKIEYTEDAQSKREAQINRRESAAEDFKTVTGNLVGKESDEVAAYLTKMYGDRGFKFHPTGLLTDNIRVTAEGTGRSEVFMLDNWSDDTDSAEALKLRKFLSENQQLGDYIDLEREEKKKAEETIVDTEWGQKDFNKEMDRLKGAGSQAQFELAEKQNFEDRIAKDLSKYSTETAEARKLLVRADYDTKQRIDDLTRTAKTEDEKQAVAAIAVANKDQFVQNHRVDNAYLDDLNKASKSIDTSFKDLNSDVEEFNRYIKDNNITQEQLENDPDLIAQKQELQVRYDQLIADAEDLDFENKKIPFIQNQNARNAALYFAYNETRGSVVGGVWNGFLRGALGSLQTFRIVDKEGLDSMVKQFGSYTTQEFAQSENRNDFSKALLSTSESLGAAAAAFATGGLAAEGTIASKVLQFVPYFSVSYNEMKNEIDAIPGMNKVPWYKKEALAIAYGIGVGYLDKLSTDFQLKSKISNKIGRDLVLRSIAGLPKGATAEAIEMAIASNFKKDLAAGVIKVVAGSVVEGVTEGVQSAYGSGLKATYDWMNGVDEFDTREWTSQVFEEAYYGALGGAIMSTPGSLVKGIKNGFGRLDPNDMELARKVIEDSNMRSMIITDIKAKLMSGEITKDQADEQINAIKESMSLLTKIPDDLSSEDTSKSMDLIKERSSIEKQIAGKDESLVAPQKARIAEINNELKTISENATKKSTEQQQEGTAEGGVVQREGVNEGQPEVGKGKGGQRETTQQGTDTGNRTVEGQRKVTGRIAINRPGILSSFGGQKFDTPLEGDTYVEGQRIMFEEKGTGRVYDLGNVNEMMDNEIEGLTQVEESVVVQPDGKLSVDGNNWNIQTDLPTMGIEYNPAGEVTRVSLKDDNGNTTMFDGQKAVDIAYQIELQKIQSPEQQQLINDLLEQDEEFKAATADIELTEAPNVVQEEAVTDTKQTAKPTVTAAAPKITETTDTKAYSEALSEAKAALKEEGNGLDLQVSDVSPEEADAIVKEGGKIFMTEDGLAGAYVKKDGYMGGLFKNPKATYKEVAKLLQQARIKVGGRFMDAYATELEKIYVKNGFRPVARLKFNEEYAPEGWDAPGSALASKPDVVFFAYDPEGKYSIGDGEYVTDYDAAYEMAKNFDAKTANEADRLAAILEKKATVSKDTISKEEVSKRVSLAQKALKVILSDVKFVVHDTDESFRKAVGEVNTKDSSAGAYDMGNKVIHINGTKANKRTVSHEVFHAIIISKTASDKQLQKLTANMVNSVLKSLKQTGTNQDVIDYLEKFAAGYKNDPTVMNEERLAELHGILGENMIELPLPTQNIIKRFLDRLAKMFGLKEMTDREAVEFMNTMSSKVETGKEITAKEFKGEKKSTKQILVEKRKQGVTLMKGTENLVKYGLNKGKNITRKVGEALEKRQREKYGFIEQSDRSEAAKDKISNWMVDEVKYFIETMGDKSGKGWYGEKYQKALDNMSKIFPEMKSDQNARDLFTMLVAITSDGQKVLSNFKLAAFAYDYYKKNGKMPSTLPGQRTASFESNLKKINKLLSDYNGDVAAIKNDLMQIKSIEELNKERKKEGLDALQTSWPVSFKAPFAASVFGPKLGMFYSNLSGNEAYPTLDRWWSRTFNRYRGTLIPEVKGGITKKGERQGIDRFKELLGDVNMSDEEAILASKTYRDSYAKKGYKNGSNVEKAANTIYKIAYENLNDAPFNKTDRQFMYDSVSKALDKLNKQGYDLSIADVQAILWYFEKNLYKTLGVQANIEGISYEDAANTTFQKWKENNKSFDYNIKESEDDEGVEGADEDISGEESKFRKQKPLEPEVAEKLTEDGNGNYVFNHYSDKKRDVIKPGTGQNMITSREEASALSAVNGLAQYYTMDMQKEPGTGPNQHTILIPKDRVYYFNKDQEGFYEEAKRRFEEVRPGQAFSPNYQVAFITQVANENGYDMVVANWRNGELRAQTTMELTPSDKIIEFKPLKEVKYEVGDTIEVYGGKAKITAIDGDIITFKGETASGSINFKRSPKSIQKVATPKEQVEEEVKSLEEEMKPKMRKQHTQKDVKKDWTSTPVQNMRDSVISKRNEQVEEAAKKLTRGKITQKEYVDIRKKYSPINRIGQLFAPASTEHMEEALGKKSDKLMAPVVDENGNEIKIVGTRLDIPSYLNSNAWVVTIHDGRKENGNVISYRNSVRLKNVVFSTDPRAALNVAAGYMGKSTFGRIMGEMVDIPGNTAEDQGINAQVMVEKIMNDPSWVQVGMNPFRQSWFWNRETGNPVVSADEVIQIGGLVYAKNAKEVSPDSDEFTVYAKYDEAKNKLLASDEALLDSEGNKIRFQKGNKKASDQAAVIVKTGKEAGLSDAGIREYMKRNGYTDRQAIDAIQAYNDKKEGIFIDPEWSSLRRAAVVFKRKFFNSRGLLANTVFASNEARLAIIAKQLNIAQKLIVDFDRELEVIRKNSVAQYKKDVRAYINGDPTVDLPSEIKALIDKKTGIKDRVKLTLAINKLAKENVEKHRADFDAYIRDKAAVLPLELKKIADSMRAHIDSISRELISNGLIDENLAERVIDNLGSYLNRSYKIYDRKNWRNEIETEVRQKAINFLKIQMRPIAEEQARKDNRDVDETLNDLVNLKIEKYLSQQEEDMKLFSSGGKLGSKNLSTLKAREEIPVEIRMLMGEYTDPGQNYARTILKMSALAANHQFLNEVKKAGTGVFLFEKNDSKTPEGYSYEIAAEGSETMNPLNGMYTSKELKEEFEKEVSQLGTFMTFYMNILSRVKWGKTIMSPATHLKNVIGNIGFVLVNGHWRINEMAGAYKAVRDDIRSLDKKDSRAYINKLIELGIVKQGAGMGEIRAMFADASWEETMLNNINKNTGSRWGKIKSGWNKFARGAENVYQAEDDFYKIFAYENELSRYSKAIFGKSKKELTQDERAEVDKVVAEIVKNTYPTYSRIPEAVNMIRRFPFVGNFISFQAESYRTAYMTAQLALQEIKSDNPKIRRIGAQRMTGALMYKTIKLGILSYYSYAAGMGLVGLLGYFTDDEEEKQKENDVRKFLPEWATNSDIVVQQASNGKIKYIDMSASDPHGGINKVINSFLLGKTTLDSFINGIGSIVEPFVGEEMTTAALLALKNNENAYGKPIYNPEDTFYEKSKKITGFMFNVVQPGAVASGRRVYNAKDITEEVVGATTGVRTYEIDVAESFGYQMIKYQERIDNANRIYTSEVYNDEATDKSIASAKKRAEKAVTEIHAEIYDLYYSAVRLGADEDKLYDNLKSFGGMTKRTINYMFGQEDYYIKDKYPEEEE